MLVWDDVRYLLALVRYGSVRGAAAALKVNHTTVSRRIRGLERRLGSRLVHRTPEGYELTSDGEVIFTSGEAVEREMASAAQRVQGADDSVSGKIRIALTDLLLDLIGPALKTLANEYPELELEISVNPRLTDIARRDADIALRLSPQPPEDLIGRKLGRMPAAIYAATERKFDAENADLGALPWIRWQEPWRQARLETWPDEHFPEARIAARVDSYSALEQMVVLGAGVAILTPWSADKRDGLTPLSDPIDELGIDLWLLMHPDLRGVRRAKTVVDAVVAELNSTTLNRW